MDTVQSAPPTSISQLAEALAKAQGEIKPPLKKCKVDFVNLKGQRVKYNYADLADVIESLREPLSKNGLAVFHQMKFDTAAGYWMRTTLVHSSGESIVTNYPLPDPTQLKPQEFGSSLTYARRYSISILIGVASEEDDDAQEAVAPVKPPIKPVPKPAVVPETKIQPVDPFPPDETQELVPFTLLDQLVALSEEKEIPHTEMSVLIQRVVGRPSRAKDLNHDELSKVVNYVKTYVMKKKPD